GEEAGADAGGAVGPGRAARDAGRLGGLDGRHPQLREVAPQATRDADQGAAGAHSGDERSDPAAGELADDLLAGGPFVTLRVERIGELIRIEPAVLDGQPVADRRRFGEAALFRAEHEVRTKAADHLLALLGHV